MPPKARAVPVSEIPSFLDKAKIRSLNRQVARIQNRPEHKDSRVKDIRKLARRRLVLERKGNLWCIYYKSKDRAICGILPAAIPLPVIEDTILYSKYQQVYAQLEGVLTSFALEVLRNEKLNPKRRTHEEEAEESGPKKQR